MRDEIAKYKELEDIFNALSAKGIRSGALGSWVRLFILHGYKPMNTTLPQLAAEIDEPHNTFRIYAVQLKKRKMIKTERWIRKGRRGVLGVTFQLLPPSKWERQA